MAQLLELTNGGHRILGHPWFPSRAFNSGERSFNHSLRPLGNERGEGGHRDLLAPRKRGERE
eukprot:962042-Prorocentrum_lima.AAC.1